MSKNENLTLEDLFDISEQLNTCDDRSLIIVGGALVESMLTDLLEKTLKPTDGTKTILSSTFQFKINSAESLGLISKAEKQDLDAIKKLRNKFAHSLLIKSLDDEEATQILSTLCFRENMTRTSKRDFFISTIFSLSGTFIFCERKLITEIDEGAYERFYRRFTELKDHR